MLARVIATALAAAVAVTLVVGAHERLAALYAEQAAEAGDETRARAEDRRLFLDLLAAGLLVPRADGGLDLASPDHLLRLEAEGALPPSEQLAEQRRLLNAVYRSAVGGLIVEQVQLWNDSRRMAAIRDDRDRPPGTTDEVWSAFNTERHPLRPARFVPEVFGFVHGGELRPGYGEWLAVPRVEGLVIFRGRVAPGLSLQVIGEPEALPEGAEVTRIAASPATQPAVIVPDGAEVRGQEEAADENGAETSAEACQPVGATVRLPETSGPVEIAVRPSPSCVDAVAGLAIHRTADGGYDWRPLRRGRPPKQFIVWSDDRVPLTDLDGGGTPTDTAFEIGLMPVVGFGPGASFSLSGLLASSDLRSGPNNIRLTVNAYYQWLAQEAIGWGIEQFGDDEHAPARKGAVVLLDADTGAILAAAAHPKVEPGATTWDYAAFGRAFPLRDPSSVLAWQIVDRHNTPGSTFKPLVGLSLMRAAPEKLAELRPALMGLDPAGMQRLLGLSPGQAVYAPTGGNRAIGNFGRADIGRYFERPERSAACVEEVPSDPLFGLREAVQFSINIWFARMSVLLDRDKIADYAQRLEEAPALVPVLPPTTRVLETARLLGLDDRERMDLAWNLPQSAGLVRRQDAVGADVLYAQLPKNALREIALPRSNPRSVENLLTWVVALNGIGQSVSVSPLHMATVAASIGTGRRIRPHMIAAWRGEPVPVPEAKPLGVDPELLAELRAGMKAVPEVGTAPAAFRDKGDLACRTYAKTGTAEIDRSKAFNSAWFIGWREPRDPEAPRARRVAFACMISHAVDELRTGGRACAPVVARILAGLEPSEPSE